MWFEKEDNCPRWQCDVETGQLCESGHDGTVCDSGRLEDEYGHQQRGCGVACTKLRQQHAVFDILITQHATAATRIP